MASPSPVRATARASASATELSSGAPPRRRSRSSRYARAPRASRYACRTPADAGRTPDSRRRRLSLCRVAVFGQRAEIGVVALGDRIGPIRRLVLARELPGFLRGALVAQLALARQLRPRGLSLPARRH